MAASDDGPVMVDHLAFWLVLFVIAVVSVIVIVSITLRSGDDNRRSRCKKCKNRKKRCHKCREKCRDKDDRENTAPKRGWPPLTTQDYYWLSNHFFAYLIIGLLTGFPVWEAAVAIFSWELFERVVGTIYFTESWTKSAADVVVGFTGYVIGSLLVREILCWFPLTVCAAIPQWIAA